MAEWDTISSDAHTASQILPNLFHWRLDVTARARAFRVLPSFQRWAPTQLPYCDCQVGRSPLPFNFALARIPLALSDLFLPSISI